MTEQEAPSFAIEKLYVKDLSLEVPNAPAVYLERDTPEIGLQLQTGGVKVGDDIFEVTLTATVTAKIGEKTVFLVEAKQAGIFEIRNLPQEQMDQVMGIACPSIVYPYLRSNVSDIVTRGGFPPVHLAEINFQAMYEQQKAQAAAQDGAGDAPRIVTQ